MAFVHVQILESTQSLLCLLKKEVENLNEDTDPQRKGALMTIAAPSLALPRTAELEL